MHDFNTNTGSDLPDLHNRRDNITTVANDCKANNYPLIAWPEDKELLRLGDLPRFVSANKRPNWTWINPLTYFVVESDHELRQIIREGFAYSINPAVQQLTSAFVVQAWQVKSR